MNTKKDIFETWDAGEFFFNEVEEQLINLPDGMKLNEILKKSTKCPVHNGTCESMILITVFGMHPEKGHKKVEIQICPLGVEGDGEDCPLNK